MASEELKLFTMAEVSKSDGRDGSPSWIVIRDKVYDVTKYIEEHPGGVDEIKDVLGQDATKAFEDVGHSNDATGVLRKLKIGELVEDEKKYKKKKKTKVEGEKKKRSCRKIMTCGVC